MTEKECTKCYTIKPLDDFGVQERGKYGRRASCKVCQYAMLKERIAKNPEKRREAERNYRQRSPEVFARKDKKYYEANKQKARESNKQWKLNNPDKVAELNRRKERVRRARKFENGTEVYSEQQVLETYGGICHLCGIAIDLSAPRSAGTDGWENSLHVDHLIPLSKGGSDTLENVRPSHGLCNLQKWAN